MPGHSSSRPGLDPNRPNHAVRDAGLRTRAEAGMEVAFQTVPVILKVKACTAGGNITYQQFNTMKCSPTSLQCKPKPLRGISIKAQAA